MKGGRIPVAALAAVGWSVAVASGAAFLQAGQGGPPAFGGASHEVPFQAAGAAPFATALNVDVGISAGTPSPARSDAAMTRRRTNGQEPESPSRVHTG